jgi:hypothetical protein
MITHEALTDFSIDYCEQAALRMAYEGFDNLKGNQAKLAAIAC